MPNIEVAPKWCPTCGTNHTNPIIVAECQRVTIEGGDTERWFDG